jgi:hypothetical protein
MSKRTRQEPRKTTPPSRRQFESEWGSAKDEAAPEPTASDAELPGTIFRVPDRHWGFEAMGREDHPGVCTACVPETLQATLVKGRDAATDRGPARTRFLVDPTDSNGLVKRTAFELVPRRQSLRRVRLLYTNRRMGALEPDLFDELCRRLTALFPPEG